MKTLPLPSKDEMFQLGELADALLKTQDVLREIAQGRKLFASSKDKGDAQAVLSEIESNPSLSNYRLKNLAKEFQAQRAERMNPSLISLELSVNNWRFIRDVLIASGDRLNLTSRVSSNGMTKEDVGGDRTVVFDAEECKEILDVLKRDIDANPFVRPMDKIFRNASKTELMERIQSQVLEHTAGANQESVRDRIQAEMAQSHLDGTMRVNPSLIPLEETSRGWENVVGSAFQHVQTDRKPDDGKFAASIRESVKKDIQEPAKKEDLYELVGKCDVEASKDNGSVAHSLLLQLAVMNPDGMSVADVIGTMKEDQGYESVEEIIAYESRVTGTIDNLVASGIFSREGDYLTSNVDLSPGQGVVFKNGPPPSHVEAAKAKPFPDPPTPSYFGCSWNPPGEEGGGFAP